MLKNAAYYIEKPTRDFIRVIHVKNNHWICVAGGLYLNEEDICIYDSMPRDRITKNLQKILSRMIPYDSVMITLLKPELWNVRSKKKNYAVIML